MKSSDWLRNLPSVSELLETPRLKRLLERVNQNTVVTGVRSVLDDVRHEYRRAAAQSTGPSLSELAERIARRVMLGEEAGLRPVLNATGNLWPRELAAPPLADVALDRLVQLGRDYADVDCDLSTGRCSPRGEEAAALLLELTGAEAALVTATPAAALWLAIAALSAGKELLIARGEVVETPRGDRLPDLLPNMGARVREIGAANHVTINEFDAACGANAGALLRITAGLAVESREPANSHRPARVELAALAQSRGIPLLEFLTHAALIDAAQLGLPGAPSAVVSLGQGVDLAILDGAGLIGGPECGIVLGRRDLVQRLTAHALAAAVQADKLTLAALIATLQLYRNPEQALLHIPILQLLNASAENLQNRAERLAPQLAAVPGLRATAYAAESRPLGQAVGSGELRLGPTWCIRLEVENTAGAASLAKALRTRLPAVLTREDHASLILDLRSLLPRQDVELVAAVEAVCGTPEEVQT